MFSGVERIDRVWYLDSNSKPHILDQVLIDELRNEAAVSSDQPTLWALLSTTSNTVSIRLDANPETAYTLYCDGVSEVADLSGSNEPAFPESFHDILVEGVLREEYLKLEKPTLADRAEAAYEKRLSGLRMFMAKTGYMDIYQGKKGDSSSTRSSGGGVAAQAVTGPTSSTDNAVVRWNGTGGTLVQNSSVIISDTDDITMASTGTITLPNSGLHIFDTDASHDLIVKPGSNLTADRILTVTTGDAARTLTISGDATVSQDYSTAGSPTLTGLTLTGALVEQGDGTVTGSLTFDADALHILDTNGTHDLIITPGSNLTADRVLTLTTGDAARTLTISADVTLDQSVATTSDVNFNTVGINDSDDSHQLILLTTSDLTSDRNLTLVPGDAARTVTISGDATISQDYSTAGSPTLTGVTTTGTTALATGSGATVTLGGGATASELRLLEPSGSGSNYTAFKAQAQGATITYTLPPDDGDSGEFLKTDGSGSLTWETPTSSSVMTLLKAGTGSTTNASAETVDSIAISGLTNLDTLLITVSAFALTAATTNQWQLYHTAESLSIAPLVDGNDLAAGASLSSSVVLQQRPGTNTQYHYLVHSFSNATSRDTGGNNAFTAAWTGSWTLGLRHGGIVAGGTGHWKWAVYKVAGQ